VDGLSQNDSGSKADVTIAIRWHRWTDRFGAKFAPRNQL
jgi:hypothetical protein